MPLDSPRSQSPSPGGGFVLQKHVLHQNAVKVLIAKPSRTAIPVTVAAVAPTDASLQDAWAKGYAMGMASRNGAAGYAPEGGYEISAFGPPSRVAPASRVPQIWAKADAAPVLTAEPVWTGRRVGVAVASPQRLYTPGHHRDAIPRLVSSRSNRTPDRPAVLTRVASPSPTRTLASPISSPRPSSPRATPERGGRFDANTGVVPPLPLVQEGAITALAASHTADIKQRTQVHQFGAAVRALAALSPPASGKLAADRVSISATGSNGSGSAKMKDFDGWETFRVLKVPDAGNTCKGGDGDAASGDGASLARGGAPDRGVSENKPLGDPVETADMGDLEDDTADMGDETAYGEDDYLVKMGAGLSLTWLHAQ